IADQIAALIDRGEFKPGARLPAERELARELGVSRTSVREAIISLEIAGKVEVRIGNGLLVRAPSPAASRRAHAGSGPSSPGPAPSRTAPRSAPAGRQRAARAPTAPSGVRIGDEDPAMSDPGACVLSLDALGALPPEVQRPRYDPKAVGLGIVHLGLGAFHRAHQAVYA